MDQRRRRVPRMEVPGWSGQYVMDDDPEAGWNDCHVVDISILGVGLNLFSVSTLSPQKLVGRPIVVHVHPPLGDSVQVRLKGEVAYANQQSDRAVRAGMEFVDLSETEKQVLEVMSMLKLAW